MEEFSKKRGRPKAFSAENEAIYDAIGLFTEVKSQRSRTNMMYQQRAIAALMNDGGNAKYGWLFDFDCMNKSPSETNRTQKTLMCELGRIADPAGICEMAEALCSAKPSVKQGVEAIRRYRCAKRSGSKKTLADELISTINDYLALYPDTEWQSVLDALNEATESVVYSALDDDTVAGV